MTLRSAICGEVGVCSDLASMLPLIGVSTNNSTGKPFTLTTVPFGKVTISSEVNISIEVDFSELEKLQRNLEKLDGEHQVKLTDLMPDWFIRENTNFQTLQAMLDAGGVKEDEDIDTDEFSQFIADRTRFEGWQDMCQFASGEWVKRQLEL